MMGDVIKNEKVTPSGTPARRRLMKMGIEEQEQKGVARPVDKAMHMQWQGCLKASLDVFRANPEAFRKLVWRRRQRIS